MFFNRKANSGIAASLDGKYTAQADLSDTAFSEGLMGPGFGIYPESADVCSPIDGRITMVFPTGHALGITREDGMELLIHIGVDTVNLKGNVFNVHVHEGDHVKQGDILISFNRHLILQADLDPTVIHVFTNADQYSIRYRPDLGHVKVGDCIADAEKK
jgi:glucose-specific phosphotransferase system IIA component